MNCPKCKNECQLLKRPYPKSKHKFYDCWYCEKCQTIYTAVGRCNKCDGELIRPRKIREGDRIEKGIYYAGEYKQEILKRIVQRIKK